MSLLVVVVTTSCGDGGGGGRCLVLSDTGRDVDVVFDIDDNDMDPVDDSEDDDCTDVALLLLAGITNLPLGIEDGGNVLLAPTNCNPMVVGVVVAVVDWDLCCDTFKVAVVVVAAAVVEDEEEDDDVGIEDIFNLLGVVAIGGGNLEEGNFLVVVGGVILPAPLLGKLIIPILLVLL
jgi:hypothetical protein